jgi:hypothetical protein
VADPLRAEAERLVNAALAAVAAAARSGSTSGFATGGPECCVCPVCRAIAAMRDPDPDVGDRLSAGVGDLAAGVAALLRSLSRPGQSRPGWFSGPGSPAGSTVPGESTVDDNAWRAATSPSSPAGSSPGGSSPAGSSPGAEPVVRKPMARKATRKRAPAAQPAGPAPATSAATDATAGKGEKKAARKAAKKTAKKAGRKAAGNTGERAAGGDG